MALTFQHLIKDLNKVDIEDICSFWTWCLADQKSVALISSVGDIFFVDKDGKINWLDTSIRVLKQVATNIQQFEQSLKDESNLDNWFLATLVEQLITQGKTLEENEVYSFKILPALGGDYSADNLEPIDISVHFAMTGQIHRQIKDLPDGTRINKVTFKPG